MAIKQLLIKLGLKGDKKTKQGLTGVDNSMKSLAKSALKVGGVLFAARGLIRGFQRTIELAKIQEVAERKLSSAYGKSTKNLLDYARALQKVSVFGDETIIEAQALIAAFVDEEEAIKKATQATLDLATAKGMELTVAADLISKTLGSTTNAMSRYGISVEGAVGSSERLESLVGNVADKFGGMAFQISETTSGQLDQIKGEWSDAMESIGRGMLEALDPKIRAINDKMQEIGDIGWDNIGKAIAEDFSGSALFVAGVAGKSGKIIALEFMNAINTGIRNAFPKTQATLDAFSLLIAGVTGLAGDAIPAVSIAMKQAEMAMRDAGFNETTEEIALLKEELKLFVAEGWEGYLNRAKEIKETNTEVVESIEDVGEATGESLNTPLLDFLEDTAPAFEAGYDQFWQSLIDADLHGKDRREQVWHSMKASFIKFSGDMIKEQIKNMNKKDMIANLEMAKDKGMAAVSMAMDSGKAVAGYIASLFKSLPWFVAVPMAAAGGAFLLNLIKEQTTKMSGISSFAEGGQFITDRPELIMVGDNPGGRERVTVEPLSSPGFQSGGNTLIINAEVATEEFMHKVHEWQRNADRMNLA